MLKSFFIGVQLESKQFQTGRIVQAVEGIRRVIDGSPTSQAPTCAELKYWILICTVILNVFWSNDKLGTAANNSFDVSWKKTLFKN